MAGCGDSGEWRKRRKSAKRNVDPAREERVLNILKEMEASIVRDETETQTILSNIQIGLEAMTKKGKKGKAGNSKKKLCVSTAISDTDNSVSKGKRPCTHTPSSNCSDAITSLYKYKPPTCQEDLPHSNPSQTSLGSSRVQQLRLFWDKFFLTDTITEREESHELLDKARFLSEAKTEMLEEEVHKKKQTRKISITPSRAPMSFRLVPSKQNRKRRVQTEHRFSDLELILSREVSTCVAKVPATPSQLSDITSSSSGSLSVKSSEQKNLTPIESKEEPVQEDRRNLYKLLLAVEASGNKVLLNRRMGYKKNVGLRKIIKMDQLLYSYTEGISIIKEEANFIDPSVLIISRVDEKRTRPRKYCTLLPCYYVTVEEPMLRLAGGDLLCLDDKISSERLDKADIKGRQKGNNERKGVVSIEYERFVCTTYTNVSQNNENADSNKWRLLQYFIFTTFVIFVIAAIICFLNSVSHSHF